MFLFFFWEAQWCAAGEEKKGKLFLLGPLFFLSWHPFNHSEEGDSTKYKKNSRKVCSGEKLRSILEYLENLFHFEIDWCSCGGGGGFTFSISKRKSQSFQESGNLFYKKNWHATFPSKNIRIPQGAKNPGSHRFPSFPIRRSVVYWEKNIFFSFHCDAAPKR